MRRRGPRPVGLALDALTDAIAPATLLAEVQRVWPQAAGERFARAAEPVSERDGVVTVACESAVWAQELDLLLRAGHRGAQRGDRQARGAAAAPAGRAAPLLSAPAARALICR